MRSATSVSSAGRRSRTVADSESTQLPGSDSHPQCLEALEPQCPNNRISAPLEDPVRPRSHGDEVVVGVADFCLDGGDASCAPQDSNLSYMASLSARPSSSIRPSSRAIRFSERWPSHRSEQSRTGSRRVRFRASPVRYSAVRSRAWSLLCRCRPGAASARILAPVDSRMADGRQWAGRWRWVAAVPGYTLLSSQLSVEQPSRGAPLACMAPSDRGTEKKGTFVER